MEKPNLEIEAIIGKAYPARVIPLINKAITDIKILVFDWRWYPNDLGAPIQKFNQAIISAKRRGVKVKALVNMVGIVGELRKLGIDCRKVVSKDLLHAKLIIIDNKVAVVGSHNFTKSAFGKNFECSVMTTNAGVVKNFDEYFEIIFSYYGQSYRN